MTSINLVEIFSSIEGEGIRAGMPCTFIRLAGCNLRCSYCDTCYAQEEKDGEIVEIDDILDLVLYDAVTITGGEPLLHTESVLELIRRLNQEGHYINIETNGSIDITPFILDVRAGRGFFTVDYKCPSSLMEEHMNNMTFQLMDRDDVVKFVVGTDEDLQAIRRFFLKFPNFKGKVFLSPCYGKISLPVLVDEVKILKRKYPHLDIRFQVQLHKIVWGKDQKGV